VPVPVSVPASIPAPREMQQRGPETGFIGNHWLDRGETSGMRYAYRNSVHPYYETVRQQQPPPQRQQQQLQYQPQQQQQWQQRRQQLEERPLPPDLPTDVAPIPTSLIPSYHRDSAVFNIPFATTVANPSRLSVHGGGGLGGADGTWGSRAGTTRRERRQTQQVPLPPPATRFSPNTPDTLGRNVESLEDVDAKVDEDRRDRPRVLKVVNG